MSIYNDRVCPVCKKKFDNEDDIVVCPDCGTPHHRECYNMLGHCVNRGLHQSGYDYYKENMADKSEERKKEKPKPQSQYYTPPADISFGFSNSDDPVDTIPEKDYSDEPGGDRQQENNFPPFFTSSFSSYDSDPELIDGKRVGDVAAAVRSNVQRFINKFKKIQNSGKKAGWNWGAAFFGPYYYLLRKIYKQGILYMCLLLAVNSAGMFAFTKLAPETYSAYQSLVNSSTSATTQAVNNIAQASDYKTALILSLVMLAAYLIINIFFTVYCDYFYKKTVVTIIDKADKKLEEENADFSDIPLSIQSRELTKKQYRRYYISRKGGISAWIPLLVFFAIDLISSRLG